MWFDEPGRTYITGTARTPLASESQKCATVSARDSHRIATTASSAIAAGCDRAILLATVRMAANETNRMATCLGLRVEELIRLSPAYCRGQYLPTNCCKI